MSRSSGRGQVEPLPALVAVGAVCLGLSLYAGALDSQFPAPRGPDPRGALDAVHDHAAADGVVDPDALASAPAPEGRRLNVTLMAGERRWAVGPAPPGASPPRGAGRAARRVSVRFGPGDVRPGRMRVVVW
jgi:hypothetical protein